MASMGEYSAKERNCDLFFLPVSQMLMRHSLQALTTYMFPQGEERDGRE